jgi:hypothetical protein
MKTFTIILIAVFGSIGLMAQEGSKQKLELKIHANARENKLLKIDNQHKHEALDLRERKEKNIKLEKRTRPHFDRGRNHNKENGHRKLENKREKKDRQKNLREHRGR